MKQRKFYSFAGWACVAGYLYVLLYVFILSGHSSFGVCMFKNVTGIPCPSCGSTRAVALLLHAQFKAAFLMNPIGIALAFLMVFVPIGLLSDRLQNKKQLYTLYSKAETLLRKPVFAIAFFALVGANWIWGIYKGL